MFRYLYYRTRHGSYLRNEHGIQKFAEMAMGKLIRKVTKKSAFYREMNENLMVEKANLRMREEELHEKPMLDAGQFFSVRRRLLAETVLIAVILISAIFLNFVAVTAFVSGDSLLLGVLRWVLAGALALVLTGGGLLVTERLIETLMGERPMSAEESEQVTSPSRKIALLWGALLIGIEIAILGIAQVRAGMLAADQGSGLLYTGFIVASAILPLIAGSLRWDSLRFVDVYKTTQTLREIEGRLAQIDSIMRQNEEYESNFYKIKSISYWDQINEFKTYKDNYNDGEGIVEDLSGHFSRSYDAFQQEAQKRYAADVRERRAPSMLRLESTSGKRGRKIEQAGPRPMPVNRDDAADEQGDSQAGEPQRDGASEEPKEQSGGGEYMNVQPIR